MRARELAALAKKQVKPEVKKLNTFLTTDGVTCYLSRREVAAILDVINTLKAQNERAGKAIRRRMRTLEEMLDDLEGA